MTPDKRILASGVASATRNQLPRRLPLQFGSDVQVEEAMTENRRNCQFHRILIGYDGSEKAERALEMALAVASASDAKVDILSVVRPPEPLNQAQAQETIDTGRKHFERALRRISEAARSNGIQVSSSIAVGHPAEKILECAQKIGADLVIVGQRGASKFDGISLGSVSERVLAYAHCPVLLTR
jgi:nucleotide-binding universal stress UspA family protein